MPVSLTGFENCRGEPFLVRAVRKMLGCQGEAISKVVDLSVFALDAGAKKVAGIKLQTGLIGPEFEFMLVYPDFGSKCELTCTFVEYKIVVIAIAVMQLGVLLCYALANAPKFAKIEGCECNRTQITCRYECRIDRGKAICMDAQKVIQYAT